tara:strand:- start:35587 stop:36240 length:654 start_codon:yes stop_codon:yes gene_type:complete
MKIKLSILTISLIFCVIIIISTEDLFTKKVRIGKQVWMEHNLNVRKFRNGDIIKRARSKAEWEEAMKNQEPAWCYFNNKKRYDHTFTGKLYNWYAVADSRGLAPAGWRVANSEDWSQLVKFLGSDVAAEQIRAREGWESFDECTNESGFTAIPGGYRDHSGHFSSVKELGYWWTSKRSIYSYSGIDADAIYMDYESDVINIRLDSGSGLAVRCIKED